MKQRIKLERGDCREVLPRLGESGFLADAIVTDPPYELSNDGKASPHRVAAELMFPQHPYIKSLSGGECHLISLAHKIADLHVGGYVPRPPASMPVGSVAFDKNTSGGKIEVKDPSESAVWPAGRNASLDDKAQATEHLGDFALELGNSGAALDCLDRVGCQFDAGGLGIGFRVGPSGLPSLLSSSFPVIFGNEDILPFDGALATTVSACGRAENLTVARLSLSGGADEVLTTGGALTLLAVASLSGAKLVRADSATSRLPAVLEARRISVICPGANRTLTLNLLLHRQSITAPGFMGKAWDGSKVAFDRQVWAELFRVLKPGGHLLAFGGTRTFHRMTCAIEDAGFEIRDCIMYMYGTGFPKSHNVSKGIDREAGAKREVVLRGPVRSSGMRGRAYIGGDGKPEARNITAPATPEAAAWSGWGTALKPAWEPIIVARKPLSERTVAANVLAHGTGALNIDRCRVPHSGGNGSWGNGRSDGSCWSPGRINGASEPEGQKHELGRWPANLIHDGSDEVEAAFAAFGTATKPNGRPDCAGKSYSKEAEVYSPRADAAFNGGYMDTGTASRFFYSAKASKSDRADSKHPTVKPLALMRYLCKLVTPPGGTILDPFAGSGTTLQAAAECGFGAVGIEIAPEYQADIARRIARMKVRP